MSTILKHRKTILLVALAIVVIVLPAFAGGKKKAADVPYEFPAAMGEPVRVEFAKQCEKGLALYNLACAHCHNSAVNGKAVIPDWTAEQLKGYELRVLNPKHEAGIPEEAVSAEELGQIMTFLTYKKKNTPAMEK